MLKPIAAVAALGLALGLAACDKGGQEQAQTPSRNQEQKNTAPTAPSSPPAASPSQQSTEPTTPPAPPSGSSGGSNQ
jgi:hypothetical protein